MRRCRFKFYTIRIRYFQYATSYDSHRSNEQYRIGKAIAAPKEFWRDFESEFPIDLQLMALKTSIV